MIDAEAFGAFGALLERPHRVGERAPIDEWLKPVPGRTLHTHLNRVAPTRGSLNVDRVERHPHAAQVFVPVGVSRYLIVVMPPDADGAPDATRARAFVVPGTTGVAYRPGTWHTGIAVLDQEGSFLVAMWRGGEDDDVFAPIPPIEVSVPEALTEEQGIPDGHHRRGEHG
jgi:ureidoglycolate lyase